MNQETKPCNTCPTERRDACWRSTDFACKEFYHWLREERTWYFTIEKDIPISAKTEEEAEKRFRERYGSQPILGIIRPSGGIE